MSSVIKKWHDRLEQHGCFMKDGTLYAGAHAQTAARDAEIAALRAALADAERDAKRYRQLRDYSAGQFKYPIVVEQIRAFDRMQYVGPLAWEFLDKAVDAAIAEQEKGEKSE